MSQSPSLRESVTTYPLKNEAKSALLSSLWEIPVANPGGGPIQAQSFFEYYSQQCDIFCTQQGIYLEDETATIFRVDTHQDLTHVFKEVKEHAKERSRICDALRTRQPPSNGSGCTPFAQHTDQCEDQIIQNAIDWAARLLTMMEIGKLDCAFSAQRPLFWESGSLKDFVSNTFAPQTKELIPVRLQKIFNAVNIERLAGIQVEWTDNLADHLSLKDDDSKVLIFHHATFLENNHTSDIFPPGFCAETLRTLALLLPSSHKSTVKWYRIQQDQQGLDGRAIRRPRLRADDRQIDNFHFWRDRLVILKQVFDDAEPSTLSQWWYDRRKGPQWYTFWVAVLVLVLTVFFGIVQSVEGALQVYKAYHPEGP